MGGQQVSVIIPAFNVARYIKKAVQSVLDQTYRDIEIIIIDDGSTDGTVAAVKEFTDPGIKLLLNESNRGPAFSRNRGLAAAQGEWIAFLDSDDWWDGTRLERLLATAEQYQADMISDDLYLIADGEQRPRSRILSGLKHYDLDTGLPIRITAPFLIENQLGMQPVIKRDFLIRHGIKFRENLKYGEDFVLYLESLMAGALCLMLPEPLYYYRTRAGSLTTQQEEVLKQALETTVQLLSNPDYRQYPEVKLALQNQLKSIQDSLYFGRVVRLIKTGKIISGLSAMLQRPSQIPVIPKRLLQNVKGRLARIFMNQTAQQTTAGSGMTVSFFLPSLNAGGAEKVFLNLAKGFAASGVETDLVLAGAQGPYLSQVPANVNIVDLKASRVLFSLLPLIRYLCRRQPTHLLSAMNHVNIIAILAARLARVQTKNIITEHCTISQLLRFSTHKYRSRIVWPLLMKMFYRYAYAIVAVSHGVADDLAVLLGIPRQRIHVIYNPVIDRELIEKSMENIYHPWFDTGQPPVLVAAGRLTIAKDYPLLIRAFAELRRQTELRLIILGEGEDRPELEKLVRDLGLAADIEMPGYVDNPYAFMRRAKVFVLSSRFEGLPTVLVEALACGAQVVSTDCPSGPREILAGNRYGILVPVGDVNGLCKAIKLKLNGHRNTEFDKFSSHYTVRESVRHYLNLITDQDNIPFGKHEVSG